MRPHFVFGRRLRREAWGVVASPWSLKRQRSQVFLFSQEKNKGSGLCFRKQGGQVFVFASGRNTASETIRGDRPRISEPRRRNHET